MVNVGYINAGGLLKHFAYCVPNFRGQVKQIPRDLFYDYKVFAPFAKCKIIASASLLLIELKCFDETMDVNPIAVKCDMKNLEVAILRAKESGNDNLWANILFEFCYQYTETLVQHSVAIHYNSFGSRSNKTYMLENKIVFATKNLVTQH
eukprot:11950016-Ditylum_brightwellii.AAC.1